MKTAILVVLFLLVALYLFWSRWMPNTHYPSPDLPWNGPDSRPAEEYRQALQLFSPTPRSKHRWYTSFTDKPEPNHYGRILDRYITTYPDYETWPGGGSAWYGGDVIEAKEAPFKILFLTINPVVAVMIEPDPEGMNLTERGRFVSSKYLSNQYYYGTQFPNRGEFHVIFPESDKNPSTLSLSDGESDELTVGGMKLTLEGKDGVIITTRHSQ